MLRGGVLRVLHRGAVHPLPDPHGRVVVGGRRSPHPPLLPGQELRHPECRGQQGRHVHVRGVRVLRLVHPDQLVRHPERRGGGPPRRDELVGSAARGRRGRGCEPRGRRGRARRQARGPEAQVRKGLGEQHAGAQQGGRRPEEQNRHPAPDAAAGGEAPWDCNRLRLRSESGCDRERSCSTGWCPGVWPWRRVIRSVLPLRPPPFSRNAPLLLAARDLSIGLGSLGSVAFPSQRVDQAHAGCKGELDFI
mmetsp:Transcript_36371/g.94977  ORF Transcript_36371/g.94977 Transcript_36371/m.94977 type:complete len:249 (+) Transcript_36371:848-1594(+)